MSYETRRRWTGQGNTMCPLERRARFGPVQPMPEPKADIFEALFTKLLRRVGR
jgi:hypothetical protein